MDPPAAFVIPLRLPYVRIMLSLQLRRVVYFHVPTATRVSRQTLFRAKGFPHKLPSSSTAMVLWISSVLKPKAIGRATPGSTATSYSSRTIHSMRSQ